MAVSRAAYLALFPALLFGAGAFSQSRAIPDDAKRGYFRHVEGMAMTVDGKVVQLASGAQIRNRQNLIIVPASFPGKGAWADYALDRNGQVFRVWVLTPEELRRRRGPAR